MGSLTCTTILMHTCAAHESDASTDGMSLCKCWPKTVQKHTVDWKGWGFLGFFFIGQNKTGPSNVTHRGQIINGFTLQCVGQLATRSTLYTLVSKLKISHRKFGSLSPEETSSDGVALPCMIEGPSLSIESRLFPRKLSSWPPLCGLAE